MNRSWTISAFAWLLFMPLAHVQAVGLGVDAFLSTRTNSVQMGTAAGLLADMGASWTRQEFNYENIGGPTGANYGADEEALVNAATRDIKTLGLLNYSASTPPSVADWTAYVSNVVGHFANQVDAWEVLNEPNDSASGARQMSAAVYQTYLAPSYDAIKAADPTATVVSAGTAAVDTGFIKGLFAAGGCSKLDGIGIHPYRTIAPETIKFGEGDFINYINTAAGLIRSSCPGKKLWLTEFGLRSDTAGVQTQANYLARSFLMARAIPEVETILSYNLRDDSSGAWGVVDTDFAKKSSYNQLKQVMQATGGQNYDGDITITERGLIDDVETTSGWGQQFNNHATATVSMVSGGIDNSQAMQVGYNFSASSAAVILTKDQKLTGQPTAIGIHMYGDNSNLIWRVRFKDANGETFQALLGNPISGWSYQQFDFSYTDAMTSWNGDGKIQYPITFNSVVVDRNGGPTTGTVLFDKIVAIYGPADLHAYKFGSTVAAWKGLNFQTVSICGRNVEVSEVPTYIENVSACQSNSIGGSVVETTSRSASTTQSSNKVSISTPKNSTSTKTRALTVSGTYAPKTASVTLKVDGKALKVTRNTKTGTWTAKTGTLSFAQHTLVASVGSSSSTVKVTVKKK